MRLWVVFVSAVLLFAGCALPPAPPPIQGPIAHLSMTEVRRSNFAADVFYVSKIDGQDFPGEIYPGQPSPDLPLDAKSGTLTTVDVPARPARFTLVGHSIFQAPVFGMTADDYSVIGDASFTLVPNATYKVVGSFSPAYSAVWVEDEHGGLVQGSKVEFNVDERIGLAKKSLFCNPSYCTN